MKIEKISDNQVKFILSQSDLIERNIKIDELTSSTEKTHDLFREILAQAWEECDFSVDNAPLMVEAVPVASNGIMIIVTKLAEGDSNSREDKLNLMTQHKDFRRFKRKSIAKGEETSGDEKNICIFSFQCLDDIIDLSIRIEKNYHGSSYLYKLDRKYFLILQNDTSADGLSMEDLENIVSEYGQKHISNVLSKYYLIEHGELILPNSAVKALAKNFGDNT